VDHIQAKFAMTSEFRQPVQPGQTPPARGTTIPEGLDNVTPNLARIKWNRLLLYPEGRSTDAILIEPKLKLPAGWRSSSALEPGPVSVTELVDSPAIVGRYFKSYEVGNIAGAPVFLDVMAEEDGYQNVPESSLKGVRELVRQQGLLFGGRHFRKYRFLVTLSNLGAGEGLEHHESSEDGTGLMSGQTGSWGELLAHEMTHSWDGKFRRPADLWTPNFNVPMRGSLLWVYEGQTQYWGFVLSGRSGLLTKQEALDALAATAATYAYRVGREWRSVEDTTNDPIIAARRPQPWLSFQRSEDYYSEGQLVWLDADTLIREKSGGKRSLDDFAKGFFGIENGSWVPVTYTFDDVVAALNKVEPYDWAKFLNERINQVAPKPPLDGLARGGWKLVYAETPTEYFKSAEARRKSTDLTYSIGLVLGREADITGVQWDGPAFKAGLTIGGKILAVNGIAYDADRLKEVITEAKKGRDPIILLVKKGDHFTSVAIDYHGGLRYPRLERIEGAPDLLSAIYAPRK